MLSIVVQSNYRRKRVDMSSGSYFTIYRKCKSIVAPASKLEAIVAEYKKSSESSLFSSKTENNEADLPLLMHENFKAGCVYDDENDNHNYYDKSGVLHEKLLEFHFCSTFTCLKEHFKLNPYKFSESSCFISKDEARKMLQAAEYVLSNEYSKKFEDILSNEYVEMFGSGYSLFDSRFKRHHQNFYIDKTSDGYSVEFDDPQYDAEVTESDNDIVFALKRMKSCLQAFVDAESYEWSGSSLVLEYSAY